MPNYNQQYLAYLDAVKKPFVKVCRLRFLNPDGTTAFIIDNNRLNRRAPAFIETGTLNVNLQNGTRRTASITLSNVTGEYDYDVNNLWFGTEIALDEGLILPDGTPYYFQDGVFLVETPETRILPSERTVTYSLVDKWALHDGTLDGNLEATYKVEYGTNVFAPIIALLSLQKGNGYPVDSVAPVFTNYYDSMTQTLPDGTVVNLTDAPYTLETDSTRAEVILGLAAMLNAWVGYDATGALRIEPSQDDILDTTKPVQYAFDMRETTLLGATYKAENTKVYNDYIVVGQALDEESVQPCARAQNLDPRSPTNINIIGRKTYREQKSGYVTQTMCEDYAEWKLKRTAILQNSVNIQCSQLFHIRENELVTLTRTDKQGSPVERHLVTGFSRPLASTAPMTISCTSVMDFPMATLVPWLPAD